MQTAITRVLLGSVVCAAMFIGGSRTHVAADSDVSYWCIRGISGAYVIIQYAVGSGASDNAAAANAELVPAGPMGCLDATGMSAFASTAPSD